MYTSQQRHRIVQYPPTKCDLVPKLIETRKLKANSLLGCVVKDVLKKVGIATREGIKCCCGCHTTYSMSRFDLHAGSKTKRGSENIFLLDGSGESLANLKERPESSSPARDGPEPSSGSFRSHGSRSPTLENSNGSCDFFSGERGVVCCSTPSCYAAVHVQCSDMQDLQGGQWYCQKCSCPECGDPLRSNNKNPLKSKLVLCGLCGDGYHMKCLLEARRLTYKVYFEWFFCWFCSDYCEQTFQMLGLLMKLSLGPMNRPPLTLVRWLGKDMNNASDFISDQLFTLETKVAEATKLYYALNLLKNSFMDDNRLSNPINLFRKMLYPDEKHDPTTSEKFFDHNGFYTVLLEEDGEVMTVATIRVHKQQVAEMPFIATSYSHRGMGYCSKFVYGLKQMLKEIGVLQLVVQSPPEFLEMWESKHSLHPVNGDAKRSLLQCNLMKLEGTTLLCKTF